jgi:hypothetical protein
LVPSTQVNSVSFNKHQSLIIWDPINSLNYNRPDVHLVSISVAVLNAASKLVMEATVATRATAILDFMRGLRGTLHMCLEEGASAESP